MRRSRGRVWPAWKRGTRGPSTGRPGEVPAHLPDLHGPGCDAELRGEFAGCEHAGGGHPVAVARDAALLAQLRERGNGEWLAPAARAALAVEDGGRLVVRCARRAVPRSARVWRR